MKIKKPTISAEVWLLLIILGGYILYTQYILLAAFGAVTLIHIYRSMWKLYQPAALLFWFLYQWVQVISSLIFADYLGLSLNRIYGTMNGELAIMLSFIGINLQLIVVSFLLRNHRRFTLAELQEAAAKIDIRRVITLYIISAVLYPALFQMAVSMEGLTQIILIFSRLKSIFVILLVYMLFLRGEKRTLILLILGIEFVTGFLTYFSTFKDVFIIGITCYLSFIRKIKMATVLRLTPLVAILFVLMVFWSAVKDKYRTFVNQGTRTQQVQVETNEAFGKLFELTTTFKAKNFEIGLKRLLYRMQYTFFFSKVMDRVPQVEAHKGGELLVESLRFVIVPRVVDAEKGVLDASVKTSKFTGLRVAGISRGTSMAIGYFGDFYIDFGPIWMMIPVMVTALLIALLYKYIMSWKMNIVYVYAIAVSVIMNIGYFESDITYLLGMIKNNFIVNLIFFYTIYRWIYRYITHETFTITRKSVSRPAVQTP